MSGVTPTGFVAKTIEELQADTEAELLTDLDPTLDVSPESPLGQLVGIQSRKLAELWELGAVAYYGFDPAAAENVLLDGVCALTGTRRREAKPSRVTCLVTVAANTTIPVQSVAYVTGHPETRFLSTVEFSTASAGMFPLAFESEELGPIVANAGTLNQIGTPVTGWTAVTNPEDATLGNDVEQDTPLRARREDELTAGGSGNVDAIRAALLRVTGVRQAFVFENTSDYANADGMPPHSVEAVVYDGPDEDADDNAIAATVWRLKPPGIPTVGTALVTVQDSTGQPQTVRFSRAVRRDIYFVYTVTTGAGFQSDGQQRIKDAAVDLANRVLDLGSDVVALAFRSEALKVPGVIDVPDFRLGTLPNPTNAGNLVIAPREVAAVDTSRITVLIP